LGNVASALFVSASEVRARLADLVGTSAADDFWSRYRAALFAPEDFARMHQLGFNCVRLPFEYRLVLGSQTPDGVLLDNTGLAVLDAAVNAIESNGLLVVLDLHTAPGGQNPVAENSDVPSTDTTPQLWTGSNAAANQETYVALWRALATHFADRTSIVGYDLLNEPALPSGVALGALPELYGRAVAAIRDVDTHHLLFLEGDKYATDFSAFTAALDANQAYELHLYSFLNATWATPSQSKLDPYLQLRTLQNTPLWLGEFGEETTDWQAQMVQLMESNGIGWSLWTWKRADLNNAHPVPQTFEAPASWVTVLRYLSAPASNPRPTADAANAGLEALLQVLPLSQCAEDSGLVQRLLGP
jgi:hypothetical protein